MIGTIRKVRTPFYDVRSDQMGFKSRPGLIIANADTNDYVVLPVSRVTRSENINPIYDVKIDPALFPALNLNAVSYIRTHKQTVVNRAQILDEISNLKATYEDLYLDILQKREEFSKEITDMAIYLVF